MAHRTARSMATTVVAALSVAALAACSSTSPGSSPAGGDDSAPGVTDTEISLGALSALTGTFSAGAKRQLAGAELYWKRVNDGGGICEGRKVKIVARDNAYDPQKTVTAYSDISSQVLAIQLITGTPMTQAIVPQMQRDSMSSIPMSWSPDLLGKDSVLIPGTTYDVDMMNAVDHLLDTSVLRSGDSIGYVYFPGDFGGAGLKGAQSAAQKHDIRVDAYQVDPTMTDVSSQVSQMKSKGNKAIFMSVSPPLFANATAVAATQGLDVPFVVPTPTFVPELLKSDAAASVARNTLVVSPYNAWSAQDPGVTQLRDAFAKDGDKGSVQQFFIAGYAAAGLMDSAIRSACEGGGLTRENLAKQLGAEKSVPMNGLEVDLDYSQRENPPSLSSYLHKVDADADGGLTPITPTPYQGPDAAPLLKGK